MPVVAVDLEEFKNNKGGLTTPATKAVAVTKSDTDELATICRALYVGGAGDLSLILAGDSAAVTFTAVPAGTILPFRVKQVKSTSTTATAIVALL